MTGAMRALVALAIVCAVLPPALHAQGINPHYAEAMKRKGWLQKYESAREIVDAFGIDHITQLVSGDNTTWEAGRKGRADCTALNTGMSKFLNDAPIYYAGRIQADRDGETMRVTLGNDYRFISVLRRDINRTGKDLLAIVLHEAWHWINEEEGVETGAAEDAETCARLVLEEDEDDDPGGVNPLPPVCEDRVVPEYYTAYEPQYKRSRVCVGPSDDVGGITGDCPWTYRLVDVPVHKVRWVTKKVCSN